MGYIKRRIIFYVTRWLVKRRWGRRILWAFAMRAMRSHARVFMREIAALYPVLTPVAAWL